jgi:hypothetical protein
VCDCWWGGNSAEGRGSTVSGGGFFSHTAFHGIVGGNTASGETATVGGGRDNVASGLSSTIPGGRDNLAAGDIVLPPAIAPKPTITARLSGPIPPMRISLPLEKISS